MEVTKHANEHFLDEVFRTLPVTDRAIDEAQQAALVAVHQGAEGLRVGAQVSLHDLCIVQLVQRLALYRPWRRLQLDRGHRHGYPLQVRWGLPRTNRTASLAVLNIRLMNALDKHRLSCAVLSGGQCVIPTRG